MGSEPPFYVHVRLTLAEAPDSLPPNGPQARIALLCDRGVLAGILAVLTLGLFGQIPDAFDVDVLTEAGMATGALVGYGFVRKLRVPWLAFGWGLITVALVIDVTDELVLPAWSVPVMEVAQAVLLVLGYQATALGLYWSLRALRQQLARAHDAEDDAVRSQAAFRALFEEAPVGFWETAPDHTIVRANRTAHKMLGLADGALAGRLWTDFVATPQEGWEAGDPEHLEDITRLRLQHSDGAWRVVEVHRNPIRDDTGAMTGYRVALVDHTEEAYLEAQREELEVQLRHTQKLETIGTLAGGIAHDFNNLLAPILGYVELALDDLSETDPLREDLEQVGEAAGRAQALVRQILTFSRQSEQEGQPMRVQDIVKEVSGLVRHSLPV